jgi:methyl-accepting chemotaxis protein
MDKPRWRRRKWLIDSEIQVKLGVKFVFVLAGYLALFYVVVLLDPLIILMGAGGEAANWFAAHDQVQHFLSFTLTPMLFAMACMVLHAIIMFHRLAGPVYRFRRGFENLQQRDLTRPIQLRKGDLLTGLAEHHNAALERIRTDIEDLRVEINSARAADCTGAELDDRLRRMETILGRWQVVSQSTPEWAEEVPAGV